MKRNKIIPALLMLALSAVSSCEFISSFIHDDEVVAKCAGKKLYRSQLSDYIPAGLQEEDSIKLAQQYINTWATELLFTQIATEQLSKSEMDVTEELEDYRHSLLKYRYEQRYINERLDTVVSSKQIQDYYDNHKELFVLDVPIVKARFLDIMQVSPYFEDLRSGLASFDPGEMAVMDSIAYSAALRYEDNSQEWMDIVSFSKYFGTDYGTLLSKRDKNGFIEMPDERGDVKIAYIFDLMKAGELAPVEFCRNRIKDIVISTRKQALISNLEQDLLENALDKQELIIY